MSRATPQGRKRNVPYILASLGVWVIFLPLGFVAAMAWQGLVIGWKFAMDAMENA